MSPQQCQESSPDRVTLHSLMTKPIQRFPQFILLLQVRLPLRLPVLVWMAGFQPCSHPPGSLTSEWAWWWRDGGGRVDCEVTEVAAPGS